MIKMAEAQEVINITATDNKTVEKRKIDSEENDIHDSKKCCRTENETNDSPKITNASFQDDKETNESTADDKIATQREVDNVDDDAHLKTDELETNDNSTEVTKESFQDSKETNEKTADDETKNETPILFNGQDIRNLSKSQMKKYQKMLSWEASKKEKRQKERQRAKERKIEARKNNIDIGPTRKQLKRSKMCNSPCKTGVVIDLSFDDLMIPKDLGKVIKQLLRVYTQNRRSKTPMQLHITSLDGKAKAEMAKHDGYEHWDCYFHAENYIDIFPKEKLVYLSSESDNVIKELEQDKIYIIGGLVDHNSHKGLCHKKAVEQGIQHGQLPISEFFTVKTRKVFTINHVFEILLRVSEGLSFKEAFEKVLPQRINIIPMEDE